VSSDAVELEVMPQRNGGFLLVLVQTDESIAMREVLPVEASNSIVRSYQVFRPYIPVFLPLNCSLIVILLATT
jgi:hypothetical protein